MFSMNVAVMKGNGEVISSGKINPSNCEMETVSLDDLSDYLNKQRREILNGDFER